MSARLAIPLKTQEAVPPISRPQRSPASSRIGLAVAPDTRTVFLRERELLQRLPFSHATLWRRINAKQFPQPVRISPRVTAWRLSDVEQWSAALPPSIAAASTALRNGTPTIRGRLA